MWKWTNQRVALGSFTDFNVWKSELTDKEMIEFTTCKNIMNGDLIKWDINDWTFTDGISNDEFSIENVNFESLCPNKEENLTLFPERFVVDESMFLCQKFGGNIVFTKTEHDYQKVNPVKIQ